jgi:hypothetical protein
MEKKIKGNKSLKEKIENKEFDQDIAIPNDLDPQKLYIFISNGNAKNLPKGNEYEITGEMALIFLQKKLGELKK